MRSQDGAFDQEPSMSVREVNECCNGHSLGLVTERCKEAVQMKGINGTGKFEPVSGKGAVARATLYFLGRYPGLIGDEARDLQLDGPEILVRWHEQDEATLYESHRNAAISAI